MCGPIKGEIKNHEINFSSEGLAIPYNIYTAITNRMLVTFMFGSLAAL